MEPADIARMALIVTLGFLAFITFLIAGTIVGLMWLESSNCNCIHFPVGLYVLALLGILLLASNRIDWVLLPIPIIWCGISGATLWAMEAPDALIMPLAALLTLPLAIWKARLPSA